MPAKDSRARGFRRHIGSSAPPGVRSETADSPLARVPNAKKAPSAVIPGGRPVASGAGNGAYSVPLPPAPTRYSL